MRKPDAYIDRLRAELDAIAEMYMRMLDASTITRGAGGTSDGVMVVAPAYDWGASTPEATAAQIETARAYSEWITRVRLLFVHAPADVQAELTETDKSVREWIDRRGLAWSLPGSIDQAKAKASRWIERFRSLLDTASRIGSPGLHVVPDTNSLLGNPDFASYARSFEGEPFTVHLIPTVLGELDRLKDQGKTQEVRDKARAVSRRLKGLRDKGNLSVGVNVTRTIFVKAEAREPQVSEIVDWLDASVPDDRIAAASLRLQSDNPAAVVVLVTSDMNLQTKADAIGLPYEETPPSLESLRANLEASVTWELAEGEHRSRMTITNKGPAKARSVAFTVATAGGPPKFTTTGTEIAQLSRGGEDQQWIHGPVTDPVEVAASWIDDEGEQSRTWEVPVPPQPPAPSRRPGPRARR
jgi:hypothetical protein